MKHEHILVIRFSSLGDVAMIVPVVSSLARQYPHVRITVLSKPFARQFFDKMAPNVGFMEADVQHEYHGVRGLNALYRRLTAKQFTAVADLHDVLRSEFLRLRFNLGRFHVQHIHKHRKFRRQLIRQKNKRLCQLPTAIENYADVFRRLGYPVSIDFSSIFPPGGGPLDELPQAIGQKAPGTRWVGIAPFAAHRGKIYPEELMLRAIRLYTERHTADRIFLFGGGADELTALDRWERQFAQATNASRLLDGFQQELILMSHLDVMLSMDSSNMHLAALTNTPVVSIWGATHPFAGFMGYRQNPENAVQRNDLSCRPCSIFGNKPCLRGDYACLYGIPPEDVVQRLEMVMDRETPETTAG